jgi:hypothetical protein
MTRAITAAVVIVLLGCLGLPMLLISAVLGGSGGCAPAVPNASSQPSIGRWDTEQVSIAATVVNVGATKTVPRWGWVVALATAMQESQLRNLPHLGEKNDHDSIGVFQQRPSQGWGTAEQLADPAYQAGRFYDKLLTVPGWEQLPLTEAAQAVQRSAYPNAYSRWTGDAILLADALASANGQTSPEAIGHCGAAGTWTQPVVAFVVSGFRVPERPGHDGVVSALAVSDSGGVRYRLPAQEPVDARLLVRTRVRCRRMSVSAGRRTGPTDVAESRRCGG